MNVDVALEPSERVLWQGRAAVGAPWRLLPLLAGSIAVTLLVVSWFIIRATIKGLGVSPEPLFHALNDSFFVLLLVVTINALAIAVCAAARIVGPFYVSLSSLLLAGGSLSVWWTSAVARSGWSGALERVRGPAMIVAAVLVAAPLARVTLGVIQRLDVWYVVTDRRVVAVRAGRTQWEERGAALGVERSWRAPRGLLVVGERRLFLRDDDPARVVDLVNAP